MDWFVKAFIRSSLLWLAVGVLLGTTMAFLPSAIVYRPAHVHANLLGFVTMMIFGVAYHVLPRFTGRPLHNPRLAGIHVWVANAGLFAMVTGFLGSAHGLPLFTYLMRAGGTVVAAGTFMFIYNIWRTLESRAVSGPQVITTQRTA